MTRRGIKHAALVAGIVVTAAVAAVLEWPPSDSPAKGDRRLRATVSASPAFAPSPPAVVSPSSGTSSAPPSEDPSTSRGHISAAEPPTVSEPAAAPYVIAAAGDIACDPTNEFFRRGLGTARWCRQQDTADLIGELDPDMVVPLGDLQYDEAKLNQFRQSYDRSWGRFKGITYPVIGNHEYYDGRPSGYFDYFGDRAGGRNRGWYSLERAGWLLVALNSNCSYEVACEPGSAQYEWLKRELASSSATCQAAFVHHPRFSSGPHGNNRSVTPLWRLLYDAGVEIVVGAHDHIYERFAKQTPDGERDPDEGIRAINSGAGGAEHYWIEKRVTNSVVRNAQTFGVLKLSLSAGSYGWDFVTVGRRDFSDSGSDVCR